ncbi:MAG: hypothetical protein FXF47_02510 [Candidatus Mcinerneyibacterium aminivorans]|uniref:Uncharacterized protein n=1 Tax=Candidatus Mcinerneyibacterium aminivorans TaxID=2703815 RepID=A0A5D0MH84_9BACT|nr:MAG: hypothetical protein FXF47_02510 [Candidatus Mcinerneyibacterium aminivorans]
MKKLIILIFIIIIISSSVIFGISFEKKQKLIENRYREVIKKRYKLSENEMDKLFDEINKNFNSNQIKLEIMRRIALKEKVNSNDNKIKSRLNMKNMNNVQFRNNYLKRVEQQKKKMRKFILDKVKNLRTKFQVQGPKGEEFGPPGEIDPPHSNPKNGEK